MHSDRFMMSKGGESDMGVPPPPATSHGQQKAKERQRRDHAIKLWDISHGAYSLELCIKALETVVPQDDINKAALWLANNSQQARQALSRAKLETTKSIAERWNVATDISEFTGMSVKLCFKALELF